MALNFGIPSSDGNTPQPSKLSDVQEKVDDLTKSVAYLEELSNTLSNRLKPVLPEVEAAQNSSKADVALYRCRLSKDLRDLTSRVTMVNALLLETLDNLQI